MGLFDALKKKKVGKQVQDLETPPMPEAAGMQSSMEPAPGFEDYTPILQQSQGFSEQQMNFPLPQQGRTISQFQPSVPSFAPEARYGEIPEEMPIPSPPEEFGAPEQQLHAQQSDMQQEQREQQQVPQVTLFGNPPETRQPQFKFYYGPEKTAHEVHETAELPFDVTQELLHMPKNEHQHQEHISEYSEETHEKPYTCMPEEHAPVLASVKKEGPHISKQFITVAALYELGEQLVNVGDDLGLAKDTVFRLTDLNELELEQMVKWQNIQQSMELRIAEIDKLLFKI